MKMKTLYVVLGLVFWLGNPTPGQGGFDDPSPARPDGEASSASSASVPSPRESLNEYLARTRPIPIAVITENQSLIPFNLLWEAEIYQVVSKVFSCWRETRRTELQRGQIRGRINVTGGGTITGPSPRFPASDGEAKKKNI